MADALAVLHWHTKIDGMDVEFVLGSSPTEDQKVRRVMPLELLVGSKDLKSKDKKKEGNERKDIR